MSAGSGEEQEGGDGRQFEEGDRLRQSLAASASRDQNLRQRRVGGAMTPATRTRSAKRTRCGDVYGLGVPTPRIAPQKGRGRALPLVPATWITGGSLRCDPRAGRAPPHPVETEIPTGRHGLWRAAPAARRATTASTSERLRRPRPRRHHGGAVLGPILLHEEMGEIGDRPTDLVARQLPCRLMP